ncbi:MAG: hypothetical protein CFE24_12725 [Flavobacterium sp. BFFFF2]|nr:MAG: hypothetical protein CFE24_12725 [Flavobacterium sp. BFFFF2]
MRLQDTEFQYLDQYLAVIFYLKTISPNGYILNYGNGKITKTDITSSSPTVIDVVTGVPQPNGVALKGTVLYFTQSTPGLISRVDISMSNPVVETVVSGLIHPACLTFNGNDLYVSEIHGNRVSKIDVTTPNPTLVTVTTGVIGPIGITIKNNELYIASYEENRISKINLSNISAAPVTVVSGITTPTDLLFIGNDLYFTQYSPEKISKIQNALNVVENNIDCDLKMYIYPNPTTDFVKLSNIADNSIYSIYSINGKKLQSGKISNNENISLTELEAGIYFLQLNKSQVVKVVKE